LGEGREKKVRRLWSGPQKTHIKVKYEKEKDRERERTMKEEMKKGS